DPARLAARPRGLRRAGAGCRRPARRDGADAGHRGPLDAHPRAARSTQARRAQRLCRLGRRVPLRRPPARLRAGHVSRLQGRRCAPQRTGRGHATSRDRRSGRLMAVDAERPQMPAERLPRWMVLAAGVLMAILLLAPAAVVLLTRGSAVTSDQTRLRAGRLPTDVTVSAATVWVVSGRDNRVVGLDSRDA